MQIVFISQFIMVLNPIDIQFQIYRTLAAGTVPATLLLHRGRRLAPDSRRAPGTICGSAIDRPDEKQERQAEYCIGYGIGID